MPPSRPLIPALVVAGDASHQLLRGTGRQCPDLGEELLGGSASERRRETIVVRDRDVTVLAAAEGEAEVVRCVVHAVLRGPGCPWRPKGRGFTIPPLSNAFNPNQSTQGD